MSNSDKNDDEIPEDFSTTLSGSVITKDDDEENEITSTAEIRNLTITCPCCHKEFHSDSAYNAHSPCPAC
jgi:hypothetical protein